MKIEFNLAEKVFWEGKYLLLRHLLWVLIKIVKHKFIF